VVITSRGATTCKKDTGFRVVEQRHLRQTTQIQHKKSKCHSKESSIAEERHHLIEALQPICHSTFSGVSSISNYSDVYTEREREPEGQYIKATKQRLCVHSLPHFSFIKFHPHFQAKTAAVNTNSAGKKPTEMAATPSVSSGAIVVSASCTAAVPI